MARPSNKSRRDRYATDEAYADLMRARARTYIIENREKVRAKRAERGRKYREKNKQKLADEQRAYWASRPGAKLSHVIMRRARQLRATPAWADAKAIKAFYAEAAKRKLTIDHVVPLRSPLVCGLHWEGNLEIIPARDNTMKGNRRWPDMP